MKRILMICMAVMVLITPIQVNAEGKEKLWIAGYEITSDNMTLYLRTEEGKAVSDLEISLQGEQLKLISEQNNLSKDKPITYMCLVDVSGSLDEKRMEQARSILRRLAENKKEEDNFCIRTIGNNLTDNGFSWNKEELYAQIEEIKVLREDTNLYYAISDSIQVLQENEAVHPNKCFIILSDGAEDQDKGITREEAEAAVRSSSIPVYTVALLKEQSSDEAKENAKVLGSFARASAGGVHYTPVLDGYESSDVAGKIEEENTKTNEVTAELKAMDINSDEAILTVNATLGDGSAAEAKKSLKTVLLADTVVNEKTEEKTEEQIPEAESIADIAAEAAQPFGMVGTAAVIVVVALVLGVIIVLIAVQKNRTEEEQPVQEQNREVPKKKMPNTLYLTQVGSEKEEILTATFAERCMVGRDKKRNDIGIEQDKAVSGVHCSFAVKDGKLHLRDEGSSNGTLLNGIPMHAEREVENGDVICIGSREYRITWKAN